MASWERLPLASNGTTASLSPWMTRVGTVTLATSPRKSVRANAVMQSRVPFGEAKAAMSRAYRRWGSLTLSSPSALKKVVVNPSRKASRSPVTPAWNCSIVASSRAPSGLSSAL